MRIRTIDVNGFGVFDGKTFDVDAPVVLFYGENEAGKSTLLHFVRNMLFGFPTRAHAEPRYEPLRGGKYGGALQLQFADGESARLERYEADGRAARLVFSDGTVAGEKQLQQRLGGLTRQVYRHLFAFGLTELEQLQTLQTEDAGKYLFSTGFGTDTARLLAAEKKLEQEMDQLFRPRGKTQTIHQIEQQLALTFEQLQQSYSKQDEYDALSQEMASLEQAIEAADDEVKSLLNRAEKLQTALQLKDRWQRKKEVMLELDALGHVSHFPANALEDWDKLAQRTEERERKQEETERKLEQLLAKEAELQVDEQLLNERESLEKLWAGLGVYMENGERLRGLKVDVEHAENTLNELTRQIDPTWTDQQLTEFPLTIAVRQEVTHFREQMTEHERKRTGLQEAMNRVTEREQYERKELERLRRASDEREQTLVSRLAKYSPLSYPAFQTKALQFFDGMKAYREAKQQLELDQRQQSELTETMRLVGETPASASAWRASIWMKTAVTMGLVGISVWLWLIDQPAAAWIVFALSVGFVAAWTMRRKRPAVANVHDQLQQKQMTLTKNITRQESELAATRKQLEHILQSMLHANQEVAAGMMASSDDRGPGATHISERGGLDHSGDILERWVLVIEQALDELARIVDQVDEFNRLADQQLEKVAAVQEEVRKQEQVLHEAKLALENVHANWEKWLAEKNFSASLAPETVLDMFRIVEQAKQWQAEKEQKLALCLQLEQHIATYETACANVIEMEHIAELPTRLRQQREAAALQAERLLQRQAWEQRVEELRTECAELKKEVEGLHFKQAAILQSAYVEDEHELRVKGQAFDRYGQLQAEVKQIDMVLTAWDVQADELAQLLETYGHDQLQYELDTIRTEIDTLQDQITERKKQYGACSLKKDQLLGGQEHAERLQAYVDQQEQLENAAQSWAVRALSHALIQRTKAIVEEERQPRMLQKASAYFTKMTEGRFTRIVVPAFEKKLLVVRASGEQLQSSELSRGTAEQLYLAMRFALVDEYARHIRLPLVLDDIFVNFDDQRLRQTLRLLQEVSEKNQIFLFTCHRHVREAVGELLKQRQEIVLERIE